MSLDKLSELDWQEAYDQAKELNSEILKILEDNDAPEAALLQWMKIASPYFAKLEAAGISPDQERQCAAFIACLGGKTKEDVAPTPDFEGELSIIAFMEETLAKLQLKG